MSVTPWHLSVIIPARNEEQLLPACLESIFAAQDRLPDNVTSDIVVVADSCLDRTWFVAADLLETRGVAVRTNAAVVGAARRMAAEEALKRYRGPLHRCWLANTDADCVLPSDWLLLHLEMAEQGIEAVAGVVSVDSFAEHGPEVPGRFQETYKTFLDGTHPHVHGANLGVRADVYVKAGGWSELTSAEDHDLWRRLNQTGNRRLSTTRLTVETSGRRVGRAPGGFADALAAHNQSR